MRTGSGLPIVAFAASVTGPILHLYVGLTNAEPQDPRCHTYMDGLAHPDPVSHVGWRRTSWRLAGEQDYSPAPAFQFDVLSLP